MKALHYLLYATPKAGSNAEPLHVTEAFTSYTNLTKRIKMWRTMVAQRDLELQYESGYAVAFHASPTNVVKFANIVQGGQVSTWHVEIPLPDTMSVEDAFELSKQRSKDEQLDIVDLSQGRLDLGEPPMP